MPQPARRTWTKIDDYKVDDAILFLGRDWKLKQMQTIPQCAELVQAEVRSEIVMSHCCKSLGITV